MMAYAKPDPANPTGVWKVHNISEPGLAGAHGMGVGDIIRRRQNGRSEQPRLVGAPPASCRASKGKVKWTQDEQGLTFRRQRKTGDRTIALRVFRA